MSETKSLLLRLSPDLKDRLQQSADASRRTLTAEVNHRLELTFSHPQHYTGGPQPGSPVAAELRPLYAQEKSPDGITDTDRAFLNLYRQLPPEKQLALITFLR